MKKLFLSTALLALTTGAALAADLPSRKAEPLLPPPPPPPMWTGIYAGLNAGYGFGTNDNTQSVGFASPAALVNAFTGVGIAGAPFPVDTGVGFALSGNAPQNQNGFIGGGQIGYNYQWSQNFVIGIEADMQGTGIRGSSRGFGAGLGGITTTSAAVGDPPSTFTQAIAFNSNGLTSINAGVDWMGTVRGRLGYLFTPTMLLYATGGLTYGGVHATVNNYAIEGVQGSLTANTVPPVSFVGASNRTYIGGGTQSQTLVGWNVGGGLEWMFMPNWSLKAEGIYWNMGNMNVRTAAISVPSVAAADGLYAGTAQQVIGGTRVNYQGVIARMGVNYHFNFGGSAPIVAKY